MSASFRLLVLLGLLLPSLASAQPAEPSEKKAFRRGTKLFAKGDYAGAVDAFEEAYRLKPHFLVQCNIARCHELAGDMVQATEHYTRCLDEGGAKTRRAAELKAALAEAASKTATVEVKAGPEGGIIFVDGKEAGTAPASIRVNPGSRVIEVRRGGAAAKTTVDAGAGDKLSVSLVPAGAPVQPEPRPGRSKRTRLRPHWFWTAVGATVACGIVAIGLGAATLSARNDYEKTSTDENQSKGLTLRAVTNVFWGLSAAGLAGTAVLFFFTDFKGERAQEPARRAFGLGVSGTF